MKKSLTILASCISLFSAANTFAAGSITGTLGVKLVLGSGCVVTGGSTSGATNDFGTVDFGSHSTLDSIITAQSSGSLGSIQLNCSLTLPYSVTLDGGSNFSTGSRHMANGSAMVRYELFQDISRSNPWVVGSPQTGLVGTGAATDLVVYGRVPIQTNQAAGAYNDTVNVTVIW